MRRKAKRYATKPGLRTIKVHEFRHSCVCNLIRQGKPLRVVANWVGDTEATVLAHYSHMFKDEAQSVPDVFMGALDILK